MSVIGVICGFLWIASFILYIFSFALERGEFKQALLNMWAHFEQANSLTFKERLKLPLALLKSIYEDANGNISLKKVTVLVILLNSAFLFIVITAGIQSGYINEDRIIPSVSVLLFLFLFSIPTMVAFECLSYILTRRILNKAKGLWGFFWRIISYLFLLYILPTLLYAFFMGLSETFFNLINFLPIEGSHLNKLTRGMITFAFVDLAVLLLLNHVSAFKFSIPRIVIPAWVIWVLVNYGIAITAYNHLPAHVSEDVGFSVANEILRGMQYTRTAPHILETWFGALFIDKGQDIGYAMIATGLSVCVPLMITIMLGAFMFNCKTYKGYIKSIEKMEKLDTTKMKRIAGVVNFFSSASAVGPLFS